MDMRPEIFAAHCKLAFFALQVIHDKKIVKDSVEQASLCTFVFVESYQLGCCSGFCAFGTLVCDELVNAHR